MTPKITKNQPILGPKMDPKMGQNGEGAQQSQPDGAISEALVSKMAPKWLKMAPNSPRQPQDSPKMAQDGPKTAGFWLPGHHKIVKIHGQK